ncbi:MAG: PilZ domain-containing protein [Phycisphaerae bacterium]|nr:PilZ domain-containing protein [Phycisphaerae bacterium]
MQFTFDLSSSQSNRVIDQAIRHRAEVTLEPKGWTDGRVVKAIIRGCDDWLLLVEQVAESDESLESVVGMHIDVQMTLGQTLYLFTTHVVDIDYTEPEALLLIARPEMLQVTQRRKFQRMTLRSPCSVHLNPRPQGTNGAVTGKLLNLSVEGMACCLGQSAAESVRIGDLIRVGLHPEEAEHGFEFDAVLANKSEAGTEGHVILGIRFDPSNEDLEAQASRQRLCDFLYAKPGALVGQGDEL